MNAPHDVLPTRQPTAGHGEASPLPSSPPPEKIRLRAALLASPIAWAADLLVSYGLVRRMALHETRVPLLATTAVCLAVIGTAGLQCLFALRRAKTRRPAHEPGRPDPSTDRTLAIWGVVLAVYFALLVLGQAYPALVLRANELA